ncbi:MAG: TetR/AcrR family transcriptional regulator [Syntrophomonadaceae bacterium]|nr:TetR/AcrR family transcriptional regulator [Syntrophomonadaceae bacterium]HQA50099.1 TetR/AcrR family transcriptional regulator [Syntrophomonadaceae bacterium]HQD91480.1 TetR/AcrR family transcriptional regulator [Syntrophomonadaceae bacterium]
MKKENLTSRDLQAMETRRKIFNTAAQLITEKGFDNVTVEEICKQSGVAKGLFYHYFNSKADIVIETYMDVDNKFSAEVMALPATTPYDRVIYAVSFQARYAKAKGLEFVKQIYKHQLDTGTSFFISEDRAFFRLIRDAIREGQQKNQLRSDFSAEVLTRLVLSISRGITYDWCLHDGDYDIEEVMRRSFLMLLPSFEVT